MLRVILTVNYRRRERAYEPLNCLIQSSSVKISYLCTKKIYSIPREYNFIRDGQSTVCLCNLKSSKVEVGKVCLPLEYRWWGARPLPVVNEQVNKLLESVTRGQYNDARPTVTLPAYWPPSTHWQGFDWQSHWQTPADTVLRLGLHFVKQLLQ